VGFGNIFHAGQHATLGFKHSVSGSSGFNRHVAAQGAIHYIIPVSDLGVTISAYQVFALEYEGDMHRELPGFKANRTTVITHLI